MSTTIGNEGVFGVAAENEMVIQSITFGYASDEAVLPDNEGDEISVTKYNEKVSVDITAKVSTTAFSGLVGSELSLSNVMPDHLQGSVSSGALVIDDITVSKSNTDYSEISIKATYRPKITSA